jgi:hypothetical protein
MHVLGHDHVSDHGKTVAIAHPFQDSKKQSRRATAPSNGLRP